MTYNERTRTVHRRSRTRSIRVGGPVVLVAALAAASGYQLIARAHSTATSAVDISPTEHPAALGHSRTAPDAAVPAAPPVRPPRSEGRVALGMADGAVPDGTTVFDRAVPGVARLDPALLGALRRAATDAAGRGVTLFVESGWRSRRYQEHLFRQAVSKYGSEREAARWVASPDTSAHVSGDAVDIGRSDATAWLSRHGANYGLCQIYRNEPWHYEMRPEARAHRCPRMYADPAHDPRMQR